MKKKWISMVLAATMLLTACGSSGGSEGKENSGDSNKNQTELTVYSWFSGGEQEACDALIEKYEAENPDIKINMNYIAYADYNSKLNTVLASGDAPDIFYVDQSNAKDWGLNGVAMDLAPLFEEAGENPKEIYTDQALFYTDDNLWATAGNLTTVVLYYNKEMLKDAGITPPSNDASNPWTWDEYVEASRKLTKDAQGKTSMEHGFDPNSIATYGTLMTSTTSWITMSGLLYSNNAGFANEDGTELAIDDPEGIEVLQSIADLSEKYHCAPTVGESKGIQQASSMLMNGQLAMFMDGAYIYPEFKAENYDIGVTAQPMFAKPSGMAMGAAWMMSAKTKNQEEAFDFYRSLTSYDYQVESCQAKGLAVPNLPSTRSSYEDAEAIKTWSDNYDEDFANLCTGLITDVARMSESGTLKNFTQIVDQTVIPGLDKLWLGEQTAEEAVSPLNEQCSKYLEGNW